MNPHRGSAGFRLRAQPQRQHCRAIRDKTQLFFRARREPGRPNLPHIGDHKGAAMKFATFSKSLVMGLALLLASSAFAVTKANMTLINPASINGTKLKPGDYKLQWEGTGPAVEV